MQEAAWEGMAVKKVNRGPTLMATEKYLDMKKS